MQYTGSPLQWPIVEALLVFHTRSTLQGVCNTQQQYKYLFPDLTSQPPFLMGLDIIKRHLHVSCNHGVTFYIATAAASYYQNDSVDTIFMASWCQIWKEMFVCVLHNVLLFIPTTLYSYSEHYISRSIVCHIDHATYL